MWRLTSGMDPYLNDQELISPAWVITPSFFENIYYGTDYTSLSKIEIRSTHWFNSNRTEN